MNIVMGNAAYRLMQVCLIRPIFFLCRFFRCFLRRHPIQHRRTSRMQLGHLAYILEGIKEIPAFTSYTVCVEADGQIY